MKRALIFFLFALLLSSCDFNKKISDKIHGTWAISYARTLEYQSPKSNISSMDSDIDKKLTGLKYVIDMKENIASRIKDDELNVAERFRVAEETDKTITLNIDGRIEVFEILANGDLLICPILGGAKNCVVLIRESNSVATPLKNAKNKDNADVVERHKLPFIAPDIAVFTSILPKEKGKYISLMFSVSSGQELDISIIQKHGQNIRDAITAIIATKTADELMRQNSLESIILTSLAQVTGISSGVEVEITKKDIF